MPTALGFGLSLSVAGLGGVVSIGADLLLSGETDGMASDFTEATGVGYVSVKDSSTPGNVVSNVSADSWWGNAGTSPKLVSKADGSLAWSPHNLFLNSAAPATQNVTLITGATYTVTVTGAGGGSITGSSGASGVATTGAPATFVATGTTGTFTYAATLTTIQINRGSVATAYLATAGTIKIGLGIDYANSSYGLLIEVAATNLALWSSDLTNVVWTASNITTAFTSTDPLGVANKATRLTATAGNGTVLQSITSGSAARISSVYLKRITGTGNIDITQDNGTTWTTVTITSSWARYSLPSATVTNPIVGIRIVTNGDAVDAALFQQELGAVATSPIPTFAATVTRALDSVKVAVTALPFSQTAGTAYIKAKNRDIAANFKIPLQIQNAGGTDYILLEQNTTDPRFRVAASSSETVTIDAGTWSAQTSGQITGAWAANDCAASFDGGAVVTDATATMPTVTSFGLGADQGTVRWNGYIYKVVWVPRRVIDATLPTWRYAP